MASRTARLLAAASVCAITAGTATGGIAWPAAHGAGARTGAPGPFNAITDVPGLRVGQVESAGASHPTGTTVVYAPHGATAAVQVRGPAPDSWQTEALAAQVAVPAVQAVVLTGGGAFGLDVASGVLRWLREHGTADPLVPGAAIRDLPGGGPWPRSLTALGYQAVGTAAAGPVRQGTAGGGTAAVAGAVKGGVGTASVRLPHGIVVGALVVVDTAGSAMDTGDCSLPGAAHGVGGEFAGLSRPAAAECAAPQAARHAAHQAAGRAAHHTGGARHTAPPHPGALAVVATNAVLGHAAAARLAASGQDGLAQALAPARADRGGGTVFALATGAGPELGGRDPRTAALLAQVDRAGADALSRAVAHALLAAVSSPGAPSYCATYPSACRQLAAARTRQPSPAARRGSAEPRPVRSAAARGCSGRPLRQAALPGPDFGGGAHWLRRLLQWVAHRGRPEDARRAASGHPRRTGHDRGGAARGCRSDPALPRRP